MEDKKGSIIMNPQKNLDKNEKLTLRCHNKNPRRASNARPTRPPTTPPTMAPVLLDPPPPPVLPFAADEVVGIVTIEVMVTPLVIMSVDA